MVCQYSDYPRGSKPGSRRTAPRPCVFVAVAVLVAAWLGLVYFVPEVGATFNRLGSCASPFTWSSCLACGLEARTDRGSSATSGKGLAAFADSLTLWLASVWALARAGAFRPSAGQPVLPVLPLGDPDTAADGHPSAVAVFRVAALLDAIPASWLVGLQVYRVFGGAFLVNWARGAMPAIFAAPGRCAAMSRSGCSPCRPRSMSPQARASAARVGIAWNVLGLLDFTIAVAIGITTAPGPLQLIVPERPNTLRRDLSHGHDSGVLRAELDHPARACRSGSSSGRAGGRGRASLRASAPPPCPSPPRWRRNVLPPRRASPGWVNT